MLLLWIELKKLFRRGLRLAAGLFLVLGVLNSGLGESMVLASPNGSAITNGTAFDDGTKLVHLQLFGGLFHLHDSTTPGHNHATELVTPAGVVQTDLTPLDQTVQIGTSQLSGNFTSLQGANYLAEILLVIAPKYQGDSGPFTLEPATFVTRHLPVDSIHPTDPFLSPPPKPPTRLILLGLSAA